MMPGVGSAIAVAGLAVSASALGAIAARRALVLITVSGGSMAPTYADGEKLLLRHGGSRQPRVGDVVVFRHPQLARATSRDTTRATAWATARPEVDWLVKRVVAVHGDRIPAEIRPAVGAGDADTVVPSGCLLVRGDNPRSLDSRHFGYVHLADVLGVSVRRRSLQVG